MEFLLVSTSLNWLFVAFRIARVTIFCVSITIHFHLLDFHIFYGVLHKTLCIV